MKILSWQKFRVILLGILIILYALWLQASEHNTGAQLRDRLEQIVYDLRLKASIGNSSIQDSPVVIVDIDEKSLQQEGQWPWPRKRIAELVDKLAGLGAVVITLDMVFSEAGNNSAEIILNALHEEKPEHASIIRQLKSLLPRFDFDRHLASSFQGRDIVLGFVFHNLATPASGTLPPPLIIRNLEDIDIRAIPGIGNYTANLKQLQESAVSAGFITTTPDSDGSIRRTPLLLRHGEHIYPSLALESARLFMLADDITINMRDIGASQVIESVTLGDYQIPTDHNGNVLIPYAGPGRSYPYLSATDVLHGKITGAQLQNRIILIGTSAPALADLKSTPVANTFPGVEAHANIIHGILDKRFPMEPAWARGANFFLMLTTGLCLAIILPYLSALGMLAITAALSFALVTINYWFWETEGLVLAMATPLLLIISLGILNLTYGFLAETLGRRQLKGMFGQYVPPELVEEMNRNPAAYHAEGETREMTVLFADIRNFTTISESLSASELKDMLNRFFTPMTRIIFEHRGTIDKYVGDMIMAFWGAPLPDEHHARHAIEAAQEMLAQLERMKPEFEQLGLPEINIGIGLNTGLMNVGDMGSRYRRAYTVLGDSVNLASRLEGLTKFYGAGVVVSETTKQQYDQLLYRHLDLVKVKGKKHAVRVYEPLCLRTEATQQLIDELRQHEQGIEYYLAQRWSEATRIFTQLSKEHPHTHLYALYLERIALLENSARGDDWDGVYERRTK